TTLSLGEEAALLVRRLRRSGNVQVAQVMQRGLIFLAHAPREVRIVQPLVACGLRHILQYTQPLLNRLSAVRRHLLPLRQDIITDVLALLRRHPVPHLCARLQFLALRWRAFFQPAVVFQHLLSFLWTQAVEFLLWRRSVRRRRPIRISIWLSHHVSPIDIRVWRTITARILPLVLRSPRFLLLLSAPLALFLSLLLLPRRL